MTPLKHNFDAAHHRHCGDVEIGNDMRSRCLIGPNWAVSDRHYGKEGVFAQIAL